MREVNWLRVGGVAGLLGVALGAFGAHGLERTASSEHLSWWDTAVRYHLVHAVALVLVGILRRFGDGVELAGWGFLVGITVFCGSLYAMALGAPTWLGAVTPVGGLGLMVGWLGVLRVGRRAVRGASSTPGGDVR